MAGNVNKGDVGKPEVKKVVTPTPTTNKPIPGYKAPNVTGVKPTQVIEDDSTVEQIRQAEGTMLEDEKIPPRREIPERGTVRDRTVERERVVLTNQSNPLVDRTLKNAFRKILGSFDENSRTAMAERVINFDPNATAPGRTRPPGEFSSSSSGATSAAAGLSVAQMILFERAQAALLDAERRLGALQPMQTPADPENVTALRAITLSTYRRLVNEFGRSGGPRTERVDKYFAVLLGTPGLELDPKGLLGKIQAQFALKSGVNTVEDSANVANFRIVTDNLLDVKASWVAFPADRKQDFGEQAGKFSRLLVMIQDDIADVEQAMDDVNFDETDRDSLPIRIATEDEDEPITIQGILSWISEFVVEEGPEMVDQGGALGIAATHLTLEKLHGLVKELIELEESHVVEKNVQASLEALLNHLDKAMQTAQRIKSSIKF